MRRFITQPPASLPGKSHDSEPAGTADVHSGDDVITTVATALATLYFALLVLMTFGPLAKH